MRLLTPMAVAVLLGGCTAASDETGDDARLGRVTSPIVNGVRSSTSQDSAVLLSIGSDGQFCTGALVAPNLVLTARHCVQRADDTTECGPYGALLAPAIIKVSVGAGASRTIVAARGARTFVDAGSSICGHDLAVVLLDQEIPNATIARVRFGSIGKSEATRTVGYGDDGSGRSNGVRFQRDALTINAIGPARSSYLTRSSKRIDFMVHAGELATGESTCFGDSGGPLFDAQDRVVGITSRGLDEECVDRPSIYSRLSANEAMIRAAAMAAGHPLQVDEATSDGPADPAAPPAAPRVENASPGTQAAASDADHPGPAAPASSSCALRATARGGASSAVGSWAVLLGILLGGVRRGRRARRAR